LDIRSQCFFRKGREVELTPKELQVLELFLRRPGRAITRDDILRSVWGYSVFVTSRSVDRCINTLRGKIEPNPAHPTFIKTIRQIGYRFDLPVPTEKSIRD
jgi:two-component system alkaline phosphatase synthesis response regulator PhoP